MQHRLPGLRRESRAQLPLDDHVASLVVYCTLVSSGRKNESEWTKNKSKDATEMRGEADRGMGRGRGRGVEGCRRLITSLSVNSQCVSVGH